MAIDLLEVRMYRHLMASPTDRRAWLGILAQASPAALEQHWDALEDKPRYALLRAPEIGLVMVRGRAGGTGRAFNLGEMTVTRCAVRLDAPPTTGFGYVAGRDKRRAELIALFDALLQTDAHGPALARRMLPALAGALRESRAARAARVAGSKVEFFTMVRGES
jgi:alpha-D-ribose 1-methylphosphonate 5-triphosphate synthase subunit PhnG